MWRFSIKSMKTEGEGEHLIAICKSCKSEVQIPFSIQSLDHSGGDLSKSEKPARKAFDVDYDGGFAVVTRDTTGK